MKYWYWAALTAKGVYLGEVGGEMEPGETSEEAALVVVASVEKHLPEVQDIPKILAVLVSESRIYIDATRELIQLDIDLRFER